MKKPNPNICEKCGSTEIFIEASYYGGFIGALCEDCAEPFMCDDSAAPTMEEQDRECEQDALARSIDRD